MTSNSNFPFRLVRLGLAFIFILFMAVASWAEITGEGTESDPYVISSVDDWNTAATESKYFSPSGGSFQYIKLANDLDFKGKTFNIFCGTVGYCSIHFDGQGYAISDISYSNTSGGAAPFAGLDDGGSISHLTVKNSSFYGSKNVAGILIGNYGGTVTDCHVESTVTLNVKNNYCGGIAAINGSNVSTKYSSVITDCSVGAKFKLPSHTNSNSVSYGGIVGSQNSTTATISNSLFYGTVEVDNGSSTFFGCISEHNYGTITGNSYRPAGGFSAFRETADPEGTTVVYAVSGLHEAATGNPAAAYIHNGVRYYAPSTKLTIGTGDENKVFRSFSATGATASLSTDKTKATLTVGIQDITVSATLLTIGGTCGSGTTWRMTDEDKNGTFETLNIGGTGALAEYANGKAPWYSDFRTTITRVNIGNDITTIPANPFYGIGNEAPIVLSTPALALKFKDAAFASKLRVPFGKYLFKATETTDNKPAYDIATADDLRNLAAAVNANNSGSGKTFFQTANIDLASGGNFTPIGNAAKFAGTYDGNRHVISGLSVSGNQSYAGLFGYVSGNIKNVILMTPSVSSSGNGAVVGAIIGKLTGNASNSYFYGGNQSNAIGSQSDVAMATNVSAAYTLTVGEHVSVETSATAPENGFQYDANNDGTLENYYRDGLELTLSHDETVVEPSEMGYALTYLLDGQKSSNISGSTLTVGSATDGKTLSIAIRSDDQTHEITYIDANGIESTAQAIALDGTETTLEAGWYFVGRDIAYGHALTFSSSVNLILGDGKTMNVDVSSGDAIEAKSDFTIYGQNGQSGILKASAKGQNSNGIINTSGDIVIRGGNVTATGESFGIKGHKNITISGGKVSATGGKYGIYSYGNITLSWTNSTDNITASSYKLGSDANHVIIPNGKYFKDEKGNVYSGLLYANQLSAIAGKTLTPTIPVKYIDENGKEQTIYNYTVLTENTDVGSLTGGWYVVEGVVSYSSQVYFSGDVYLILADGAEMTVDVADVADVPAVLVSGNLSIYGQSGQRGIFAATGKSYGIVSIGDVTISGGNVTATSEKSYGINCANVTISGGTVSATGDKSGIRSNKDVTISGGNVTATGETGYGICAYNGDITISWTNSTDAVKASSYYLKNSKKHVIISNGKALKDEDGNVYSGKIADVSAIADKKLVPCEYMVTFDSQNGSDPVTVTTTFDENGAAHVAKPDDPTRSGYTFAGWFTDKDGDTEFDITSAITANTTLYAKWGVPYIDEDGSEKVRKPGEYTVLTNDVKPNDEGIISLTGGWYVVQGVVSYSNKVYFSEDAYLILADGAELNVKNEVKLGSGISAGKNLTIYGQSGQRGTLTAKGDGHSIYSKGRVTINGGNVTATSRQYSISGSLVTIRGGFVTVTSENASGFYRDGGVNLTITGGTVTASGGRYGIKGNFVTITGGIVTAVGGDDGIYCYSNITLSLNNSSDYIKASSYHTEKGSVKIADGKLLKDENGNVYGGLLTNRQLSSIKGLELKDFTGVSVSFVDNSSGTPVVFAEIAVDENGHVTAPAKHPFHSGHKFLGWYESDGITKFNFANITASTAAYAKWEENTLVEYIDENGEPKSTKDYVLLTNDIDVDELPGGWYVVQDEVRYTSQMTFNDDAYLILANGAKLNVEYDGVENKDVNEAIWAKKNLTIYGQRVENGESGSLTASSSVENGNGIIAEGDFSMVGGSVTAIAASGFGDGICGYNGITLSWTNRTDAVKASGYYLGSSEKHVTIAEGKAFTDENGNVYRGTLGNTQLTTLKGKKLEPFIGAVVSFVDNSSGTPVVFAEIAVDENGHVESPAKHPFHSDSTFLGWFTAPEGGSKFDFAATVTENTTAYAQWEKNKPVEYIDENGATKSVTDYIMLTNDIYVDDLPGGWYVVQGKVNYTSSVRFGDDVNLILADGAEMYVETGDEAIYANGNLTIYSQGGKKIEAGERVPSGKLTAIGRNGIFAGNVTVVGGYVTASSNSESGYGIHSESDVVLGWTSVTDSIKVSNYYSVNTIGYYSQNSFVTIAEGKSLKDANGNVYRGTLSGAQLVPLKGQKLEPFIGTVVSFVDNSSGTPTVFAEMAVDKNGHVAAPAKHPFRSGKTFLGWYEADGVTEFNFNANITANTTAYAKWGNNSLVEYIDENGVTKSVSDYVLLTNDIYVDELPGDCWFVVQGKVSYTSSVRFGYNVNLILADGAEMYVETSGDAISANSANENLTIYSQGGKKIEAGERVPSGKLTAIGRNGILAGNVIVVGGNVTALSNSESGYGIYCGNDAILGWTNVTDSIKVSRYYSENASSYYGQNASVSIAEGKSLKDANGNVYRGKLSQSQVSAIKGQKLEPFTGTVVSFVDNSSGVSVVFAEIAVDGEGHVAAPAKHPFRSGKTFLGWYAADGVTEFDFTATVTGNTTAYAKWGKNKSVEYIDENGVTKSVSNYILLTNDIYEDELPGGWYVVENSDPNGVDVSLSSTLSFSGDVNLILADDAELNISGVNGANNIVIDGDAIDVAGKLTVYGQSNQTGSIFADAGKNGINAKNRTVVNGGSVKAYGTSGKGFKGTLDIHFKHYKNSIVASSFDGSVTVSGLALTERSKKGIYEGDLDENQVTVLNKIAENSLLLEPCYVVKFDKGDGSDPEFLPAAFDKNGVAHVARPADPTHVDGYSFLGWFNLDNTKFDFDAPVTANTDVFAHWEKDVLTVTFDTQDGHKTVVEAKYDENGKAYVAKPEVPTREGYSFLEWVYIPDGSASENPVYKRFDFTAPVTANMTVYAKWWENVPVEYSVAGQVNSIGQYTVLTSWTNVSESLPAGWYVVVNSNTDNDDDNGVDVRFIENLSFGSGVTRIILLDGAEMVVSDGVNSTIYADVLNVYGQTGGTGKLTVNSGNKGIEATNVNIYGGVVDAKGVMAGIYSSRTVSIYGGKVSVPKTSLYGIYVGMGDLALDWNDDGDRYTIGGYTLLNGSVIIAENKYFTDDGGNVYKGKLNDDQVAAIEGKTLKPANAVPYIDENGKEKFVTNYTVLTSDVAQTDENGVITLPAGWYVVQGNVELANRIAFAANDAGSKDVHLILADDAKMKVETEFSYAIGDSTLSTLTIYGQKNQSGVLEVSSEIRTGIYSYKGSIAIVGGHVNVSGENGIEANYVTIAGGNVEAKGDCYGISSVDGITLGWMNSTDAVKASSYDGTVTIATGKAFKDENGNEYRGTLEADQIADIAGQKLVPLGPKSLTSEDIVITDIPVQNYDKDNPVCPDTVIVTDGDYVLKDDKDYMFECFNNTEVSSATLGSSAPYVKITGTGNYKGEIEKRFYIWENIGKYAAVQVYKDYGGVIHAEIDGDYTGEDAVNIPKDIEVDMVNFNRKFTVTKNGGFSTLMLPFSVKSVYVKGVEGIYKFAYVADCDVKKDGKNDVCVNKVWENTDSVYVTLEANTPYMVKMKESTLRINTKVTLAKTTDGILYDERKKTEDARKGTWQMHGVFGYKKWKCGDDELGKVWGYAGEPRKDVYIGKYVKFGKEVWINPFRAYLYDPNGEKMQCADNSQPKAQAVAASPYAKAYTADFLPAPAKSAANATASSEVASLDEFGGMQVVVVEDGRETSIADGKGTTAVGRKNPTATQIRLKPRTTQTYDLKGRRVGNGKKAKGAYYRR